jgi:formylglycine-generating enzyme required for sulfatase activity
MAVVDSWWIMPELIAKLVRALRPVAHGSLIIHLLGGCQRASEIEPADTQPTTAEKSLAPTAVRTSPPGNVDVQPPPPTVSPVMAQSTAPVTSTAKVIDVPAGSVTVDDKRISVGAFAMDRTEVTVEGYARCVAAKMCSPAAQDDIACNWPDRKVKATHPINCVTVKQAKAYCEWRGQRLPTAPEWQLAAGGPDHRHFPWGASHPSNLWVTELAEGEEYAPGPARHNLCWVGDDTAKGEKYPTSTCKVGSFPAGNTPLGIADLAGNVAEWTSSTKKLAGGLRYLVKGGGYNFDPLGRLQVSVADEMLHDDEHFAPDVGFRCATAKATPEP